MEIKILFLSREILRKVINTNIRKCNGCWVSWHLHSRMDASDTITAKRVFRRSELQGKSFGKRTPNLRTYILAGAKRCCIINRYSVLTYSNARDNRQKYVLNKNALQRSTSRSRKYLLVIWYQMLSETFQFQPANNKQITYITGEVELYKKKCVTNRHNGEGADTSIFFGYSCSSLFEMRGNKWGIPGMKQCSCKLVGL